MINTTDFLAESFSDALFGREFDFGYDTTASEQGEAVPSSAIVGVLDARLGNGYTIRQRIIFGTFITAGYDEYARYENIPCSWFERAWSGLLDVWLYSC